MSTQAKHTPGPWQAIIPFDGRHRNVPVMAENGANRPDKTGFIEPGNALVASCSDSHVTRATAEANARLIAAAPDLLEELKNYNWIIEQYLDGKLPKDAAFAAVLANRVNGIAIAKADGRE